MDDVSDYLAAIVPTIGVAALFYFIVKAMMEGDRRERLAQSQLEAERDRTTPDAGPPADDIGADETMPDADPGRAPTDSARHQSSSK
ncbi:MAG: hypothetical protein ACRCSN_15935 [Dermatophilaceae bacterium]